jgi:hypothetical protein
MVTRDDIDRAGEELEVGNKFLAQGVTHTVRVLLVENVAQAQGSADIIVSAELGYTLQLT